MITYSDEIPRNESLDYERNKSGSKYMLVLWTT